ncbi:MAG: hypothetical protein JXR51_12620, partial [Bacteroidales bacterium]|nr:hypothetical protein [Bacteroidales bacterium]
GIKMKKIVFKNNEILIYEWINNEWAYMKYGYQLTHKNDIITLKNFLDGNPSTLDIKDKEFILEIDNTFFYNKGERK